MVLEQTDLYIVTILPSQDYMPAVEQEVKGKQNLLDIVRDLKSQGRQLTIETYVYSTVNLRCIKVPFDLEKELNPVKQETSNNKNF